MQITPREIDGNWPATVAAIARLVDDTKRFYRLNRRDRSSASASSLPLVDNSQLPTTCRRGNRQRLARNFQLFVGGNHEHGDGR